MCKHILILRNTKFSAKEEGKKHGRQTERNKRKKKQVRHTNKNGKPTHLGWLNKVKYIDNYIYVVGPTD